MSISRWLTLVLLCTTAFVGAQGLVWEQQNVEFKAKPGDTEAKVEFRFTNQGKRTLNIRRVRTTCGCTGAKTDREVYAPGEKGTLSVTFRFEGRTGQQMKTVFVTTDDPDQPTTTVQLSGMLPWNVQLSQRLLLWTTGGESTPQEVLVELNPNEDITLLKVELDTRDFACTMAPTDVPRQYRLLFTPTSIAAPAKGIASLKTKPALNDAEIARARIFLYVR